jgi:hypothetical protein
MKHARNVLLTLLLALVCGLPLRALAKGNPNGAGSTRIDHMLTMANHSPKSTWPQHEKNMLDRLTARMQAANPKDHGAVDGAVSDIRKLFADARAMSPAQFASHKSALMTRFRNDMTKGLGRSIQPGDLEGLDDTPSPKH